MDRPTSCPWPKRTAVFDDEGTLGVEQRLHVQAFFDRIRELAPQHPPWQTREPFASVLRADLKVAMSAGEAALVEMVMATHAGTTADEFSAIVADWLATVRHPVPPRPFTALLDRPLAELLAYLRPHGFKTFVVCGGGVEFTRVRAEQLHGAPRRRSR